MNYTPHMAMGPAHRPHKWQHENVDSTLTSSQAVPHPSTNRALCRLTAEVRGDPVHSTRYGRQRVDIPTAESQTA